MILLKSILVLRKKKRNTFKGEYKNQLIVNLLLVPCINCLVLFFFFSAQAGTVRKEKPSLKETPVKEIFTSIPFLSLVCCHFGNMFLLFFYQNAMMLYLTRALGFELTKGGFAASLPWGARMLFGFFFSWAGDTLKRKEIFSITVIRKGATIFCK